MLQRLQKILSSKPVPIETESGYYNKMYQTTEEYGKHFSDSMYYAIWSVIVDRTPRTARVFEVGCGPGQLAQFLDYRGIGSYCGFDFSAQAIAMAKKRCPHLSFQADDALTTELFNTEDYDLVICTEVLEHIEQDLQVVKRIRSGSRCLLTVPNFPWISHVRYFSSGQAVLERYGDFFKQPKVDSYLKDSTGACYHLLEGHRT